MAYPMELKERTLYGDHRKPEKPEKQGRVPFSSTPNNGAGRCIWTTEEQPGVPRFLLRDIDKVTLKVGRLLLIHNLLKQAKIKQQKK